MNKKLLIALGAASVIVIAGVASAGIVAYNSCGYDEQTGMYREPFGYSTTDIFFINQERGKGLQSALNQVADHADRLGPQQLNEFKKNCIFEIISIYIIS